MDAVEFLKETERMCKSNEECIKCDGRNCCVKRRGPLCDFGKFVEIVENWAKTHPVIQLTEQQKTAIRGRIAEGTPWLSKHSYCEGIVVFYSRNPKEKTDFLAASSNNDIYNFVTIENSPLYLPDLLGGEE